MSDKIYKALPEDFIRRMRNWARAVTGQLQSLRSGWDIDPSVVNPGLDGSSLPLLHGEADDTDQALRALQPRFRWAVEEFWSREGRTLREHSRGRHLSPEVFELWVMTGHEMLRAELRRKTEAWSRARDQRAKMASV